MPQALHTTTHSGPIEEIRPSRPAHSITVLRRPERRDLVKRHALVQRVQREFDEMPGTSLTLAQATRLFGLSAEICGRILQELVSEGTLTQSPDSRYRLSAL